MNEWIRIQDFLPDCGQTVLVCDEYNSFVTLGRFDGIDQFELMNIDDVEIDSCITHWMPLPKPPEDL